MLVAAGWWIDRQGASAQTSVTRFALHNVGISIDAFQGLALSPDGRRLVYRAIGEDGRERLYVRSFDSLEVNPLPGSELGWLPFFSPDGERVGFFSQGGLKAVMLASGIARTIATVDRGGFSGATWLPDDSVIFANSSKQLGRVHASGGEVEYLEVLGLRESDFVVAPSALPGGDALLCGVSNGSTFDVAVFDLADRTLTVIAENGFTPTYSASGHVLYQQGQNGPLMAMPFDPKQRAATGAAFPVISDLGTRVSYQVRMFTIANDGTLAYIPNSTLLDKGALAWVDRQGSSSQIVEVDKMIDMPRISHDGRRVAFRAPAPNCDIWVHDLERGVTTRLTREGDNHGIAWSPDDKRLAFARLEVPFQWGVRSTAVDGAGNVDVLSPPTIPRGFVSSFSSDGDFILVGAGLDTGGDVYLVTTKDQSVKPLLNSRFMERAAVFSPDGRYLAYVGDESGREEVYVQPFPALDAREQISTDGGAEPVWSRDGKELFFKSDRKMMVVDVVATSTFSAGRPRQLLETELSARGSSGLASYDVSPDGQRFVMVRERTGVEGAQLNVVLGWFKELGNMAPKGTR